MPKFNYTATDPNGGKHTRSSDRVYTHTVVGIPCKDNAMAIATNPAWHKQDAKNFAYYLQIAAGNDPFPAKSYISLDRGDTQEQVDADMERVRLANEKRRAEAMATTAGIDEVQYCTRQEAARIAHIETNEARGYYSTFVNLGWCGRADLARSLARKSHGGYVSVTILDVSVPK